MKQFPCLVLIFLILWSFPALLTAQFDDIDPNVKREIINAIQRKDINGAKEVLRQSGLFEQAKQYLESSGKMDDVRQMMKTGDFTGLQDMSRMQLPQTEEARKLINKEHQTTSLLKLIGFPTLILLILFLIPYRRVFNGLRRVLGLKKRMPHHHNQNR